MDLEELIRVALASMGGSMGQTDPNEPRIPIYYNEEAGAPQGVPIDAQTARNVVGMRRGDLPGYDPFMALNAVDALLANVQRAAQSANPVDAFREGYDPSLSSGRLATEGASEALPDWARGAIGLAADLAAPDPFGAVGDVGRLLTPALAAFAPRRALTDILRSEAGTPQRIFRAESSTGQGPVAQAFGEDATSRARYYSSNPYETRDYTYSGMPDRVIEGTVRTSPEGLIDTRMMETPPELIERFRGALNLDNDLERQAFEWFEKGELDLGQFLNELRDIYGHDLGELPERMGIDVLLQNPDDNLGRVSRFPEVVVFNPESVNPMNVLTPEEFRNLYPRGR